MLHPDDLSVEAILEEIKFRPNSLKTFLGENYLKGYGTYKNIINRKVNNLWKQGFVNKCVLPGGIFCRVLFYDAKPNYNIVVTSKFRGYLIYYCDSIKELPQNKIQLINSFKLESSKWVKNESEIIVEEKNIFKIVDKAQSI